MNDLPEPPSLYHSGRQGVLLFGFLATGGKAMIKF
jgi:hypothetical protein